MFPRCLLILWTCHLFAGWCRAGAPGEDILRLFQRHCLECHGPTKQKGGLRLDTREGVFADPATVVPGNPGGSELFRRVTLPRTHDEIMPNRGEPLSRSETTRLRSWIESGAPWPDHAENLAHWAYLPPVRPPVPRGEPGLSPVDAFVRDRLRQEKVLPSPEADRPTLIRRVTLDLTGLPPTPDEVADFVADDTPEAWERVVNRLLQSPQFGVRWARPWLDYARYADSHGFQRDDLRDLWPYRDWVVAALNADLPFDQFTIEQIAGDLLPGATESQKIATGFNRSAPTNVEAGSDPEETRVNQVLDRVNTVGMIWLGTTLECAQCHDHKYDPITMRDYYGLFAFFNHTELEADRANPKTPGSIRFLGPEMPLHDPALERQRAGLETEKARLTRQLNAENPPAEGQDAWEHSLKASIDANPSEEVLEIVDFLSEEGAEHTLLPDGSVLLGGSPAPQEDVYVITTRTKATSIVGFKLEALTDPSLPGQGPGRGDAERPNFVLNQLTVSVGPKVVTFSNATASFSQAKFPVSNLLKPAPGAGEGWAINPRFHEPHWAILETDAPIHPASGETIRFRLEQRFGSARTIGRLRLSALTGASRRTNLSPEVVTALRTDKPKRSAAQKTLLEELRRRENPAILRLEDAIATIEKRLAALKIPTTLVMKELPDRRKTAVFQRGDFRNPGATVEPATPAVFSALRPRQEGPPDRLDLARWLVSRDNPLVARVVVNRWWAELFGQGLVTTPEDFGIKGEPPSHPELLDWLAAEFMDTGWSMKKLLHTLVLSRTYRQSARVTPSMLQRDDRNLLLARGPRFRLDAEGIRDNALAISGLLCLRQGGEPIRPWQPDNLWTKVGGERYDYRTSPGDEAYRRGLYVVWKRGAPYPSFINFDANARLACRVKRPRSNTPLQALTLMNDPVYVEAAQAFARRILRESASEDFAERAATGFALATSRRPRTSELAALQALFEAEKAARGKDPAGLGRLLAGNPPPEGISAQDYAAWIAVATALLNLDETINKG